MIYIYLKNQHKSENQEIPVNFLHRMALNNLFLIQKRLKETIQNKPPSQKKPKQKPK